MLKLGFEWKAEGKLNNLEIVERLQKLGCKVEYKSFSRLLQNPFYCGFLVHSLIPGEVIKGHHPALVSYELFMKANTVLNNNPLIGISKKFKQEELPLKSFVVDEIGGSPMTGYKTKNIYYYKSRDKGSKVNVRATRLNELFLQELKKFELHESLECELRHELMGYLTRALQSKLSEEEYIKSQISKLKTKTENLEERFIEGDVDKELYLKFKQKYSADMAQLAESLEKMNFKSSNLEKAIDLGIQLSRNLSQLWLSADYTDKQRLQKLVFPDGIGYNKENDTVRTYRVNSVFGWIAGQASISEKKNDCNFVEKCNHSHWVASSGIEPESGASETLILSIVLRGQGTVKNMLKS